MLGLRVAKSCGEKVRKRLLKEGNLNPNFKIKRKGDYLIFPLKKPTDLGELVETQFEKITREPHSLREALSQKIPREKLCFLKTFDVVGDIGILEIPEELSEHEREIGESLLKINKNLKVVLKKSSDVFGEKRLRKFSNLAGEERTTTLHREFGCIFYLDLAKVYFSPRLSTERLRIAKRVQRGEIIYDAFCGVGPFSIIISKFSEAERIHSSDINPDAIHFLKMNLKLNKIENVEPILGDAKDVFPELSKIDRCIMNLPKSSFKFLSLALKYSKIIHLYSLVENLEREIEKIKNFDKRIKIGEIVKVKSYSPKKSIYRFDIWS